MRLLDLFSGIGGFSLAAQWVWGDELEIVAFCEIDKFCQKVLKKHWPNVPIIEDVRDVAYSRLFRQEKQKEQTAGLEQSSENVAFSKSRESREQTKPEGWEDTCGRSQEIDLLTGGFPCQPFSVAGKRKGREDNRFLWPEMFAVIKEIRPRWVVAENVAGIVRMALDDCLSDLEGKGYSTRTIIIPACAVNAPHRRDRVWIVANSINDSDRTNGRQIREENGLQEVNRPSLGSGLSCGTSQDVADSNGKYKQELFGRDQVAKEIKEVPSGWRNAPDRRQWESEPDVGRVAHGIPSRVDRLKSLGNAIVPQVAYQIFKAIKEIDKCQI